MRRVWWAVAAAFLALLAPGSAWAQKRLALVIGNDRYPNLPATQQLHNAVNDARAMKATLAGLGFEVLDGEDLDRAGMIGKLSALASRLEPDDIAFFFYAGHGVALNNQNFMLPTDIAAPQATGRDEEERLADLAVSETRVTDRLKGARVAVVVLDSCRDNPLAAASGRSIGGGRGLARPPETEGVLSIYSAGIGQQALDRLGDNDQNPNSVFTRVFAETLKQPGMGLREAAFKTQGEVARLAKASGQVQVPGVYSQILGADVVLGASAGVADRDPPQLSALADPQRRDLPAATLADPPKRDLPPPAIPDGGAGDFKFAESVASAAGWRAFLRAHPDGPLADVAKDRLVALLTAEPAATALGPQEVSPPRPADPVAPSFDCAKARSVVEHQICSSPALAALDQRLARLFTQVLARSATPLTLQRAQSVWLGSRDACAARGSPDATLACVTAAYDGRVAELQRLDLGASVDDAQVATARPVRPSFDCARAFLPVESLICATPQLAADDQALGAIFLLARQRATVPAELAAAQGAWRAVRDRCASLPQRSGAIACVDQAYKRRITELQAGLSR